MSEYAVVLDDISVRYHMSRDRAGGLKEYMIKAMKREIRYDEFWALSDISVKVKKGEIFGVVGPNGAGKSTLMRVIAGIITPTTGAVDVRGTVAPLIALGAGFDPNLTANENIYLNGTALGFSREFMKSKHQEILEFAELTEFADVPIKTFSSGMYARLGFAVATLVRPDVLILDEILSVGDATFQAKAQARMNEIIYSGATVILVSHSIETVRSMCNRAMLIHQGRMVQCGPVRKT